MKKVSLFSVVALLTPLVAFAQTAQIFVTNFLKFLSDIVVPFLIGIAFLLFVINVIRFFVIQGDNQDGRENAKNLAIYSVSAFVIIVIFWGVVNLFSSSLGLDKDLQPIPDYCPTTGC